MTEMKSKHVWMWLLAIAFLCGSLLLPSVSEAGTSYPKVMWGKVQVHPTTVGKIVVTGSSVYTYQIKSGKIYKSKALSKGEYGIIKAEKGRYYMSSTVYVPSNSKNMKYYPVPSTLRAKVLPQPTKVMWGKLEVKKGLLGTVTLKQDSYMWQLDTNYNGQIKTIKAGTYPVYGYVAPNKDARGERYVVGGGWYVSHVPVDMVFTPVPADLVKKAKLPANPVIKPTAKHYFSKEGEEFLTPEMELPFPYRSQYAYEKLKVESKDIKDFTITFDHERVSETGYIFTMYVDGEVYEYFFIHDGDLELSGEDYEDYFAFKSAVLQWVWQNQLDSL